MGGRLLIAVATLTGVVAAGVTSADVAGAQTGPTAAVLYVAATGSDDAGTNTCTSPAAPCATLAQATAQAATADPGGATIYVTGTIDENGTANISTPLTVIGSATPTDPSVIDDTAPSGSSVIWVSAPVTANLDDLTITGGTYSSGAGIDTTTGSAVDITDSTITGNTANVGGGIFNNGGTVYVTDSTITGNTAQFGGGIGNNGAVVVTDSTITGNTAQFGGGIDSSGGVDVTDSTITGNSAPSGGAIYNIGRVDLTDSTVADNTADAAPYLGGIVGGRSLIVGGSVFAGNICAVVGFQDAGGNVTDQASSSCVSGSDVTSMSDSDLGSLAYNGGPTETMALLAGNSAVGAVASGCPATDQRGLPRPQTGCDAGAYQTGTYTPTVTASPSTQTIDPGATATVQATVDIGASPAPAGLPVEFAVTAGPDTGQTAAAVTATTGTATFALTHSGTPGTDVVSVTSPIAPGAAAPGVVSATPAEVVVGAAPQIGSGDSATFSAGHASTFEVTATGTPTPQISETGALPNGVTLVDHTDGTATLAGTPAAGTGGVYPITITATNGIGTPASQPFVLTVDAAPAFTSPAAAYFPWLGPPTSFPVAASGYPAPKITLTGNLPPGLSFDPADDTITGTAGLFGLGTHPVTVTATNGIGATAVQTLNVVVGFAPALYAPPVADFHTGRERSFTVFSVAYPTATVTATGVLPAGNTFAAGPDGTATLAGSADPGSAGDYPITLSATNPFGTSTLHVTLQVHGPPQADTITVTNPGAQTDTTGTAVALAVTATDSERGQTLSYSAAGLPAGLSIDPSSGLISGTPTTPSINTVTVTATDREQASGTTTFTWTVAPPQPPTVEQRACTLGGVTGTQTRTRTVTLRGDSWVASQWSLWSACTTTTGT